MSRSRKPAGPSLEVEFFRLLNRVVEPLVRAGIGSPRLVPGGFIVLETVGRLSGKTRRSPLAATVVGSYVVVATFRGERSQWVRNLAARPNSRIWLRGRARNVRAFVIFPGKRLRVPTSLPAHMQRLVKFLAPFTRAGWAFAVLSPREA